MVCSRKNCIFARFSNLYQCLLILHDLVPSWCCVFPPAAQARGSVGSLWSRSAPLRHNGLLPGSGPQMMEISFDYIFTAWYYVDGVGVSLPLIPSMSIFQRFTLNLCRSKLLRRAFHFPMQDKLSFICLQTVRLLLYWPCFIICVYV